VVNEDFIMLAYAGKILHVDLSSGRTQTELLNDKTAKSFIGGIGLALNLLMDVSKPKKDAYDPDNPLIFCTGPLTGTLGPAGNGYVVVSKSPATGGVGESKAQSFFGAEIKRAGYDAIVIKGKASQLSYLWIDDDKIEIRKADHLKGNTPKEVEKKIRDEQGDFDVRVSSIGVAGEKLCRYASIVNEDFKSVSRTGLGGVMGSKNLKAIAIRGTHDVNVASLEAFKQFVKKIYESMKEQSAKNQKSLDAPRSLVRLNQINALATKNWTSASFDGVEILAESFVNEHYIKKTVGCATCGMPCDHIAVVPEGTYKGATSQLDFESLSSLGPLCGISGLDAVIEASKLINDYGLDCTSTGAVVAFAMDLYENGIITKDQTEGIELKFGNPEALMALIHKIAKREGWLGNVLAEGVARAAQSIGGEAYKYACHIKALEMPGFEIRTLKPAALGLAVAFNGADPSRNEVNVLAVKGEVDASKIDESLGKIVAQESSLHNVIDSLILCKYGRDDYDGWKDLSDYFRIATGIALTQEEMMQVGDRIENLARLFNVLEGKGTRNYDTVPYKFKNVPIKIGGHGKGIVIDDEELQVGLDHYYSTQGWTADGIPTVDRLKRIGLGTMTYISENAIKELKTQSEEEANKTW
jgi:aldehyde:ferredoxin oxidoreductase